MTNDDPVSEVTEATVEAAEEALESTIEAGTEAAETIVGSFFGD